MAKKTTKKPSAPPAEPKEKAVFLRMMPEDLEIIEIMKKAFFENTANQAVIKGLHDWLAKSNKKYPINIGVSSLRLQRDI
jgi:hypothetical protein